MKDSRDIKQRHVFFRFICSACFRSRGWFDHPFERFPRELSCVNFLGFVCVSWFLHFKYFFHNHIVRMTRFFEIFKPPFPFRRPPCLIGGTLFRTARGRLHHMTSYIFVTGLEPTIYVVDRCVYHCTPKCCFSVASKTNDNVTKNRGVFLVREVRLFRKLRILNSSSTEKRWIFIWNVILRVWGGFLFGHSLVEGPWLSEWGEGFTAVWVFFSNTTMNKIYRINFLVSAWRIGKQIPHVMKKTWWDFLEWFWRYADTAPPHAAATKRGFHN